MNELSNSSFMKIKSLYEKLADEESKMIFRYRLLYCMTNDIKYMSQLVLNNSEVKFKNNKETINISEFYKKEKEQGLVLYGAGHDGKFLYNLLIKSGCKVECFCDSYIDKQNELFCGLRVISPEVLKSSHYGYNIIISSTLYTNEIHRMLIELGYLEEQIYKLDFVYDHSEYFDTEIFTPKEHEVFIDGGCYDFASSLGFIDWCNGNYDKIYAFEPDTQNFNKCKKIINDKNVEKSELINAGLWNKKDTLCFSNKGTISSSISDIGMYSINTINIDEIIREEIPTFIKLDIEGAELEALQGAANIIEKYRPKLAICLYHKPQDILDIPLYILKIVPDYKFYIRHYSPFDFDTVLYAV